MTAQRAERVESLDLIRGVAVLGILAINIAGFAGPGAGVTNPHVPTPGSFSDELAFGLGFLVFEGKMRALFTILFGASLVLFVQRAEEAGRFGALLQMRRLAWLALFGLLHFYLIWWGDILFLYAACGVFALLMRELRLRRLVVAALALFAAWHLAGAALDAPSVISEQQVLAGTATPAQTEEYEAYREAVASNAARQLAVAREGFVDHALYKVSHQTLYPLESVLILFGETLPLMLLGIALCRSGFFSATWPRKRMLGIAVGGTLAGLVPTAAILGWAWVHDFPIRAMESAFVTWTAIPHLLMAIGYAAVLVLVSPALTASAPGRWLAAAGRMAFSNYIATSLVMTTIFYGWGLGLAGSIGPAEQWAFVILGWALMLAWSAPWLHHFRRGPLEWAWRSLTENRLLAFRH
ncbi:MAG: DUF418 domain-containing protein [Novosphingobium sp.]|nr:DUF418 domain-containing protein [Novosphingobium sp.]